MMLTMKQSAKPSRRSRGRTSAHIELRRRQKTERASTYKRRGDRGMAYKRGCLVGMLGMLDKKGRAAVLS